MDRGDGRLFCDQTTQRSAQVPKEVPTMFHPTSIGLDVHARSVSACAINALSGEIVEERFDYPGKGELFDFIGGFEDAQCVYEAGPTGFDLCRKITQMGVECVVCAPSKLPEAKGDKVKTDRRDARNLARFLAAGITVPVHVPTLEEEGARDLSHAQECAREDLTRIRMRIDALLLKYGYHYDDGGRWTREHRDWLAKVELPTPESMFILHECIEEEKLANARKERIEDEISRAAASSSKRRQIENITCLRGVGIITAYCLTAAVCDWELYTPRTISSYLGLIPSEDSSGETRSQGRITKSGNKHARKLLVEAAWHHAKDYRPDRKVKRLKGAFEKASPRVQEAAERANMRLNRRWDHFKARGMKSVKTSVAISRELAVWCQVLATME